MELVIALPVLLAVTALMVNFASLCIGKIRAEVAARDAVWRVRWPRDGGNEPPPPKWPADASLAVDRNVPLLNELDLPGLAQPVAHGPLPNGFEVRPLLDFRTGVMQGVSDLHKSYPMLSSVVGPYRVASHSNTLLDPVWQNAQMGFPNRFRRTLALYEFPQADQSLVAAFARSVIDVMSIPHWTGQYVMYRDEDIRKFYGHSVNFYPWLAHPYQGGSVVQREYCEIDPQEVYDRWLRGPRGLVDNFNGVELEFGQISRLPRQMTRFFHRMYQQVQEEIERLREELGGTPPPTPERRAWILERLRVLESIDPTGEKLRQLEADLQTLDDREDQMRAAIHQQQQALN